MRPEILVIGEALIDVVRRPGEPVQRFPGGSPLNVAVSLGRLGHEPLFATWFAADEGGEAITAHLAASHVHLLPGSDQGRRTTTAEALIDAEGHATYCFDADSRMVGVPGDLTPAVVHTGSLGAILDPGFDTVVDWVEAVHGRALVTFDPNCRPSVMGEAAQVRAKVERYAAVADVIKISDEDLAWLYPGLDDDAAMLEQARRWLAAGVSVVVITLGALGSITVTHDSSPLRVPADTTHGLIDTVGAGDSFMAGIIHGLVTHGLADPAMPSTLGTDQAAWTRILTQAAAIAGLTVSRAGANPPWLAELGLVMGQDAV